MKMVQQVIYYGAPGTGKSYGIKRNHDVNKDNSFRTTFHPDSDYSTFVGCYKPIKDEESGEISYDFVPQVFTEAYIKAWENYAVGMQIFLIIEEINRGNCAQIFGDLFQLLDRDEQGFSDYEIKPEKDLQDYLAKHLGGLTFTEERLAKIPSGTELILPPNFNIIATMNTSDQSLFPIDSAFKRRWSWRYTAIKDAKMDYRFEMADGTQYGWWDFLRQVNDSIKAVTESEDKKMGYFFVHPNKKQRSTDERATIVTLDLFVSKVLFYLWTDIFKDYAEDVENNIFRKFVKKDENGNDIYEPLTFNDFFDEVGAVDTTVVESFLVQFHLEPKEVVAEDETDSSVITSKDNRIIVTLPNGKVIQEDKNNQTFAAVIRDIATSNHGAIEILKTMKCGNYPLLSEEKLVPTNNKEKLYADQQREFDVDGTTYYLHTKIATAEMRMRIERLLTKLYPDQVHPLVIGGYKVEMKFA